MTPALELLRGRLSLQFVVFSTLVLVWIAGALFSHMALLRLYHRLLTAYRASRRALYEPALELVLLEETYDRVLAALRPRGLGDLSVIEEFIVEHARHLEGPPFDTLKRVCIDLGIIDRNLRALRSHERETRGKALEVLGILRTREAIGPIEEALVGERMDLTLAGLRALAAIGDAAALPFFIETSDRLHPAVLVRLASLMLEFGRPSVDHVRRLVERHPHAFSPRSMQQVLREMSELGFKG